MTFFPEVILSQKSYQKILFLKLFSEKNNSQLKQIHGNFHFFIFFDLFPRLLHLHRPVNIINYEDRFVPYKG